MDFRGVNSSLHWMEGLEARPVCSPSSQPAPGSGGSPNSGVLTQVTSGSGTAADELQGPEQLFQFSVSSQANGGLEKAISQNVGRIHELHEEMVMPGTQKLPQKWCPSLTSGRARSIHQSCHNLGRARGKGHTPGEKWQPQQRSLCFTRNEVEP